MNLWYRQIVLDDKIELLDQAITYFEEELKEARKECNIKGSLEQAASRLPGIFEYRFSQLQEIEAILKHLNSELDKTRSKLFRKYLETYNRELNAREAEKFIDGEDEVMVWNKLINSVALIRNQYLGLTKSLDHKNWQVSNIVKLRTAGLEDTDI